MNLGVGQEKGGDLFGEVREREEDSFKAGGTCNTFQWGMEEGKNNFLKEVVLVKIEARFLK